ncbi:RimK family alpha-L-glutamate ligase [Kitasatospora sp. NPDC059327]|uniref:RimK family alpha-L-glutamate ligase n=1 Tax=Kitasatospora sp. NPDC059327 TaxID=3346803 RepID=UPI0036858D47
MDQEASATGDGAPSAVWLLLGPGMRGRMSAHLTEAFGERFGPSSVVFSDQLVYKIAGGKFTLHDLTGRTLLPPKVAYARLSADRLSMDREITLLRHLQAMGVSLINSAESYLLCANKFRQLQELAAAGLPVPDSWSYADAPFDRVIRHGADEPRVVKAVRGNRGNRVFLAPDAAMLSDVAGSLAHNVPYLFQEFLSFSKGRNLRVVVVDGQAVSTAVHTNTEGGFKSNLSRGASGDYHPGRFPEAEDMACRAAAALGLGLAGVDLLFRSDGGFTLCEINPSPQWGQDPPYVTSAILATCRLRLGA